MGFFGMVQALLVVAAEQRDACREPMRHCMAERVFQFLRQLQQTPHPLPGLPGAAPLEQAPGAVAQEHDGRVLHGCGLMQGGVVPRQALVGHLQRGVQVALVEHHIGPGPAGLQRQPQVGVPGGVADRCFGQGTGAGQVMPTWCQTYPATTTPTPVESCLLLCI